MTTAPAPSLRDLICRAQDARVEPIEIPEWSAALGDRKLYLRVLTGMERDAFEAFCLDLKKMPPGSSRNVRAFLASKTLCDETGARIFTDADVAELGKKSGLVLDRIWRASLALNMMQADDTGDAPAPN